MNEYILVCLNELRNVIKMTYKSCDPHSLSYLLRSNMVSSEVLQSVTMHCSYQMFQHCAESLSRQLLNWHYMYAASRSQERISRPVHWLSRCSQNYPYLKRTHIHAYRDEVITIADLHLSLPSSYKYTTYEVLKMGMPKLLLQPIPFCSFTYSRQLGENAGKLPHKLKKKRET